MGSDRWTSKCAEEVFHTFLEETLPWNPVQPAIEKQKVFCKRRLMREVYLFETNLVCATDDGGEGNGGDTYDDYFGEYSYYDNNGSAVANATAYDLPFEDHRDINRSESPTFDLESEDYHCLDMVMGGTELAGITVIKCNSADGEPGHLTKCCPRFVKKRKQNIEVLLLLQESAT